MASPTIGSVKGLVALVTGSGSGLGKATLARLVREGVRGVVAIDQQNQDKGSETVLPLKVDVSSEEQVAEAIKECEKRFKRLDLVVNCAGVGVAFKTYNFSKGVPHALDEFKRCIEVNAIGTFNVNRLAVGLIGRNEPVNGTRGCLINTASIAAYDGQVGQVAYAASKGAIVSMTLPMARDLAPQLIRCVTIAPGLFDTPLLQSLPEKVRDYLGALVPNPQRLGFVDEYAHLVQAIVENPMINGEVIRLDGALRMPP